jgi:hypothetical protein
MATSWRCRKIGKTKTGMRCRRSSPARRRDPGDVADEGREDDQRGGQDAPIAKPSIELALGEPALALHGGVVQVGNDGFGWQVPLYRIDEVGKASYSGGATLAEDERVDDLMTLDQAIAEHMKPAVPEAETNQRRWVERKPKENPEPEPQRIDPATDRFLADGNEVDYAAWEHARRRL